MGISAGLAAIGTTIASWVGVTTISAVTATMIGGAIVGAAIGGLTAALTHGDIGKGVLFGTIGGAVTGGVSGWAGGLSGATLSTSMTTGETYGAVSTYQGVMAHEAAAGAGASSIGGAMQAVGSSSSLTDAMIASSVTQGASALLQSHQQNKQQAALEASKDKEWEREKERIDKQYAHESQLLDKRLAAQLETAAMQNDAAMARIAEDRRQFDIQQDNWDETHQEQLKREADRRALFTVTGNKTRGNNEIPDVSEEAPTPGIYDIRMGVLDQEETNGS